MTTLSSRASITSIAERSAWIIVMLATASASFRLAQLVLKMQRHVLVDVLEHRCDRGRVAVEQRAVLRRLLERGAHLRIELLGARLALGRPRARRVDGEKVVAVDAQRGDAAADAARCEGRRLAAGERLEGRDRPL